MLIKHSDEGMVFLPTLFFLLLLTLYLLWQVDYYHREQAYLHNQKNLMHLENLLHIGVQKAVTNHEHDFFIRLPIGDVLGERLEDSEGTYKLKATLRNGKERVATFTVSPSGEMLHYKEGD
ncbi:MULTISPECIES: hypothetical protein [Shouchella]|uniref:Uncharacterized protein n=2 Tax=Bacillaceae TaxID=186817 RepID=A0A9D5DP58_9BACI|nr:MULTISPECIES: hypothetical protein [Bacillaceae]KQL57686.1 hypothetical protein AN965_09450 [Alkalicoccobacillus plakortidis]MBG9784111.1 hypothetical protein [Shouchella lehensis]TES50904.1 hypothetical protein E2L03_02960 [Shouchella lehensis]